VVYLDKLKEYSEKYQVAIHSYVLMTNHVHILATPSETKSISQLIQALGRYYVRYINQTYGRTGSLWEGRYKSTLIDSDKYFLTVSRYIELNPVRAKMVDHPSKYPWSSYHYNALDKNILLIHPHPIYNALGITREERKYAYQKLFEQLVPEYTIQEIRVAINKAWVLGDKRFRQQIEQQVGRRVESFPHGGDRKSNKYKLKNQLL